MAKRGLETLLTVKIKHGRLSAIVPEALEMAFTALTMETRLADAKLILEETPVVLRCRACGREFSPEGAAPFAPCPACGEELGHTVVSGRELYIEYLELE